MYLETNSVSDCLRLQGDINKLYDWYLANRLPLNIEKRYVVTFSRSKCPLSYNYKISNTIIKRTKFVTDLGVTYDDTLSFKTHVQRSVGASYKSLGFLMRESSNFNIKSLKLLCTTLVLPKLEYASAVWFPHTSGSIKQIEGL